MELAERNVEIQVCATHLRVICHAPQDVTEAMQSKLRDSFLCAAGNAETFFQQTQYFHAPSPPVDTRDWA